MNNNDEIYSSTGGPGASIRPDGRLYFNGTEFIETAAKIADIFEGLVTEASGLPHVSRVVCRAMIAATAATELENSEYMEDLEVSLPLTDYGHDASLVYLARNDPDRTALLPIDDMIAQTAQYRHHPPAVEILGDLRRRGVSFTSAIDFSDVSQIAELWGPTFGWDIQQVENLAIRLTKEQSANPQERSVWFCAARLGADIISLATAERLTMPGHGRDIDLVETTEWHTAQAHRGNLLMTTTLNVLNGLIVRDLRRSGSYMPLIYSECNFQTRSDKAGHAAGMRIPFRLPGGLTAPQMLIQNVSIGDGADLGTTLRDFSFLSMPPRIMHTQFSPAQIETITHVAGLE